MSLEELTTGRHLSTVKGSTNTIIHPKTSGFISRIGGDSDFIYAAEKDSQLLRFWSYASGFKKDQRVILPGKISCVAVTSCGTVIFVGIGSKIYVWKLTTGVLLAILEEVGLQSVTVIKIAPRDDIFSVGSEDGVVCVWKISSILSKFNEISNKIDIFKSFDSHSSVVTDVYFGSLDSMASVGLDCKLVVSVVAKPIRKF
jgi:pre-rRNA-processing protein IPI3